MSQNTVYGGGDVCEYTEQIQRCIQANQVGSSESPRSIEDFICITSSSIQSIMAQIILDYQFKEIDFQAEEYLSSLEEDKNKYFGKDAQFSYVDGINEIIELFYTDGIYAQKYRNVCGFSIREQLQVCHGGSITNHIAIDFFEESTCMELAFTKLDIYKQVAFDILMLNKIQVRKDAMKSYVSTEREKYSRLLDIMMINIGYMERIFKKWTAKIKNPYQ